MVSIYIIISKNTVTKQIYYYIGRTMSDHEDCTTLLQDDIISLDIPSQILATTSQDELFSQLSTKAEQTTGKVESDHSQLASDFYNGIALDEADSDSVVDDSLSRVDKIKLHIYSRLRFMRDATSFDGLKFLNGSHLRQIIWIAIFFFSVLAMCLVLYIITAEYVARNTSFTRQKYFPQSLKFPAITICSHNPYYKITIGNGFFNSLPIETQVAIEYEYYKRDRLFVADSKKVLELLDSRYNISNTEFNQSVTLETILREYGHKLKYWLKLCMFDGKDCNIDDFTEVVTAYGLCYTFNLDGTKNVTGSGTSHTLFLIADIEQHNYMYYTSHTAGIQVFIHPQDEYPYSGELNGFSVPPGFETQVAISFTNTKLMEPPYGQCGDRTINDPYILPCKISTSSTEDDDMNLTNSTHHESAMMDCPLPVTRYTRQRCLDECEANYQHKMCGCKADYLPGANITVCDLNKLFDCLINVIEQFGLIKKSLCDCLIECNRVQYKTKLSKSYFPANRYQLELQRLLYRYVPYSEEDIRKNMLTLLIYYDQLEYNEMTEEVEFDAFRYLADFGSHLGLFTGAGVMTLFELFELCLY